MTYCQLNNACIAALVKGHWPCLEHLHLGRSKVNVQVALVQGAWPTLRTLSVCCSALGAESVSILLQDHWTSLKCLVLPYNAVRGESILSLSPDNVAGLQPGQNTIGSPVLIANGHWPNLQSCTCLIFSVSSVNWSGFRLVPYV